MKKTEDDKIIKELLVSCPSMKTHNRNGELFTADECHRFLKNKQYQIRNKTKRTNEDRDSYQ